MDWNSAWPLIKLSPRVHAPRQTQHYFTYHYCAHEFIGMVWKRNQKWSIVSRARLTSEDVSVFVVSIGQYDDLFHSSDDESRSPYTFACSLHSAHTVSAPCGMRCTNHFRFAFVRDYYRNRTIADCTRLRAQIFCCRCFCDERAPCHIIIADNFQGLMNNDGQQLHTK